jgi:hypothetical protein
VGADLERRVAWFSHLLDAYDPGRLGQAVDVRTTALDRASRKAVPTMSAPANTTPTSTPEWGAQPPTPNPKKKRPIMRVVGLVIGGLLVVGVVTSAMSGDNQPQATGSQASTDAPAKAKAKNDSGVSSGLATKDATADVKVVGISGSEYLPEVKLLITNHSEKRSDYYVELSMFDASGTNVGWTNAMAMAVEPGARAKVSAPITSEDVVKVKVHEIQRTASS